MIQQELQKNIGDLKERISLKLSLYKEATTSDAPFELRREILAEIRMLENKLVSFSVEFTRFIP